VVVTTSVEQSDNDELSLFIASTLAAIIAGTEKAKAEVGQMSSAHGTGIWAFGPPTEVGFDIAVTAKRTGSVNGGFKLEVFSVGVNAGAKAADEDSTVSRISFKIPNHYKKLKE
jgi:hypothetical protein